MTRGLFGPAFGYNGPIIDSTISGNHGGGERWRPLCVLRFWRRLQLDHRLGNYATGSALCPFSTRATTIQDSTIARNHATGCGGRRQRHLAPAWGRVHTSSTASSPAIPVPPRPTSSSTPAHTAQAQFSLIPEHERRGGQLDRRLGRTSSSASTRCSVPCRITAARRRPRSRHANRPRHRQESRLRRPSPTSAGLPRPPSTCPVVANAAAAGSGAAHRRRRAPGRRRPLRPCRPRRTTHKKKKCKKIKQEATPPAAKKKKCKKKKKKK